MMIQLRVTRYQWRNSFNFRLQIHPFEGKTVQMQRVRERILPVQDPGSAQDPPYGRITAQMPSLFQIFQPKIQFENAPAYPYRS